MDFVLSDDQESLRQELRRLLDDRVTSERRREGTSRELWAELGAMGVFALTLPEADGGTGLGLAEAVVVFEELGRAAVAGPLIATFLAAGLVDGAAEGTRIVGAAAGPAPVLVAHLDEIDALLVEVDDQVELLELPPPGEPIERPLDPLTPVSWCPELPRGRSVLDATTWRLRGSLLVAAMQVGLGQAALNLGVQYAGQRQQFGRTIGSFQAVKHLLADAAVGVETARAGVQAAAVTADEHGLDPRLVHGARVVASHAADRSSRACIQVHGGMGFTWELDAHLFFKRALVLDTMFGSVDRSLTEIAETLG